MKNIKILLIVLIILVCFIPFQVIAKAFNARQLADTPIATYILTTQDGKSTDWTNPSGLSGIVGGSDTEIQYNDGGVLGGDPEHIWNDVSNTEEIGTVAALLSLNGQNVNFSATGTARSDWSVVAGGWEFNLYDASGNAVHTLNSGDSGGVLLNQQTEDMDFSYDGASITDVLFVDASENNVEINSLNVGGTTDAGDGNIRGNGSIITTGLIESTGGNVHALGGTLLAGELNTTGRIDLVSGDGVSVLNIVGIDVPSAGVTAWDFTVPALVNTVERQVMMASDTSGNTVWGFPEKFSATLTSVSAPIAVSTEIDLGADMAAHAGTIVEYGVQVAGWIPITGTDTLTVRLYVSGSLADSFTSTAGAAGFIKVPAPVIEAYSAEDYLEVKVEITTQTGGLDSILLLCWLAVQ